MNAFGAIQVAVIAALGVSLAAKILAQSQRGVRAIVLGRARDGILSRLEPVAVAALFLWFVSVALHGTGLAPRLFEPRLFQSRAAGTAGAILALGALGLQLTAFVHMGRSWRIGIDPGSRERLVTTGVFGVSRNPIYLALDLLAVSAFAMSGSVYFLVSGLVVVSGIHVQILREERFLAGAFAAEYESYRGRVHRYLGRPA
jgi:protein-S-isoprenylcysteine O-methyltransferase Ste14